ncbi:MAG: UDP-glucose/GDP-mannose dehydrogenase family protein [Firmicutes bacterium]|nr:UDP-glucose/GDP-mannose dehydrogenase family protein [Bacillota bacterium]
MGMKITVIGSGYVGLIAALGFGIKNNKVICVDKDKEKIKSLKKGIPIIYEKGLDKYLKKCIEEKKITFSTDIKKGIRESNIIFIAVGTPALNNGDVDMTQVKEVINDISKYINEYKVIVNKSTVAIGTQKYIKRMLNDKGISNEYFDIVSNPEFLREGKAFDDFFNTDRIVIGYDSEIAKEIMGKLYKNFNKKIVYTNPETAELIKYASNGFLATKISFINEIANLCDEIGGNVEDISYVLGLDKRISPLFLNAGIGFGGSCFPKDTQALVKIGKKYGVAFNVIKSTIDVNNKQRIIPIKKLLNHYKDISGKIISVLGLTFKPGTDDIREAPAIYIINELIKNEAIVKCYDPNVSRKIKEIYPQIEYCNTPYDTFIDSSCAIFCTEWDEFSKLDLFKLKDKMKEPLIIDGRNIFDYKDVKKAKINYFAIGRGYIYK